MPSPLLWSLFLLWLIATSAMLLMMLPGSTTTRRIISLFIAAIASVLAYYRYSTALVQAAAITNLSSAIYHCTAGWKDEQVAHGITPVTM